MRRTRLRPGATRTAALLAGAVTLGGALTGGAPPAQAAVRPCSNGLVALTFDDGPATAVTGTMLDVLDRYDAEATFFVVGTRVDATPALVRAAHRRGFLVANHTYGHEMLTRLSDSGIRGTVWRTNDAIRRAGARPAPLVRPPYGATDSRVRRVLNGMGLTEVLWDIDPRDWESGTAAQLTARVLVALRPGGRNIVLLHDGVSRSRTTLAAVPGIIRGARERGYCLARLGPGGLPVPPVPRLAVSDARVTESDPGTAVPLRFRLTLDRPTSRPVSVRVRTVSGTATPEADYRSVTRRVKFAAGSRTRTVKVRVRGDRIHEGAERLRLVADLPRHLLVGDARAVGTVVDDDPLPRVSLTDASVAEPLGGTETTQVRILADRPSSRRMVMVVATVPGTADQDDYVPFEQTVRLLPGERTKLVPVTVRADETEEPEERFRVQITSIEGAALERAWAEISIVPPPTPEP